MKYLMFGILLVLVACSRPDSPEGLLQEFVEYRFKSSQSRDTLLGYTHGGMQVMLQEMDDEQFQEFTADKGRSFRSLTIRSKNCKGDDCFLTYVLSYTQAEKQELVETKKIAKLSKIDEKWYIVDVQGVKTFVDFKDPIDIGP